MFLKQFSRLRFGKVWRHCRRLPAWQRFLLYLGFPSSILRPVPPLCVFRQLSPCLFHSAVPLCASTEILRWCVAWLAFLQLADSGRPYIVDMLLSFVVTLLPEGLSLSSLSLSLSRSLSLSLCSCHVLGCPGPRAWAQGFTRLGELRPPKLSPIPSCVWHSGYSFHFLQCYHHQHHRFHCRIDQLAGAKGFPSSWRCVGPLLGASASMPI